MKDTKELVGYLPDERPSPIRLLLYALQQVIVMFPATVAVALITGFQVSTTIFASGLATICFILITGRKIPMYYGSSFSYLSAVAGLVAAQGFASHRNPADGSHPDRSVGIIASVLRQSPPVCLLVLRPDAVDPTAYHRSIKVTGLTLADNALATQPYCRKNGYF